MTRLPDDEPEPDPELARLLQEWTAPALPDSLDERVRPSCGAAPPATDLAAVLRDVHPRSCRSRWRVRPSRGAWRPRIARARCRVGRIVRTDAGGATGDAWAEEGLAGFEPVREMNVTVVLESAGP